MKKANPVTTKKSATKKVATTTSKKAATTKSTAPKKASSKPKVKKEQDFKLNVSGEGSVNTTPTEAKDFILNQGDPTTVYSAANDDYWAFERDMQESASLYPSVIKASEPEPVEEKDSNIAGKVIITVIVLAILALIFGMS